MSARSCARRPRSERSGSSPRTAIRRPKAARWPRRRRARWSGCPGRGWSISRARSRRSAKPASGASGWPARRTWTLRRRSARRGSRWCSAPKGPGLRPNTREHCDALARLADQRRDRKPQRVQRRRGRALCGEHRLMVRTAEASTPASTRWPRSSRPSPPSSSEHGIPEPRASEPGAHTLLRTIVGQQVSVAAARSMWAKLEAAYRLAARPQALLTASDEELRAAGISRQKAGYARSLAQLVLSDELDLANLPADDEEAIALLTRSRASAAGRRKSICCSPKAAPTSGRPATSRCRSRSAGCSGWPNARREKQLRELAEAWRPHRGAAAVLAWHSYNSSEPRCSYVTGGAPSGAAARRGRGRSARPRSRRNGAIFSLWCRARRDKLAEVWPSPPPQR